MISAHQGVAGTAIGGTESMVLHVPTCVNATCSGRPLPAGLTIRSVIGLKAGGVSYISGLPGKLRLPPNGTPGGGRSKRKICVPAPSTTSVKKASAPLPTLSRSAVKVPVNVKSSQPTVAVSKEASMAKADVDANVDAKAAPMNDDRSVLRVMSCYQADSVTRISKGLGPL